MSCKHVDDALRANISQCQTTRVIAVSNALRQRVAQTGNDIVDLPAFLTETLTSPLTLTLVLSAQRQTCISRV